MKRFFNGAILLLSLSASFVFAQTNDIAKEAAFSELSILTGTEISNNEQAKVVCDLEKYIVSCAEIGKKHNLFSAAEKNQVDAVLFEFKGKVVEDLKSCTNEECLLSIANKIAASLNKKDSNLAKVLDLTAQKIDEKKNILVAAKEIGVNLNDCRSLDPDTASLELLRACAKLAKHESVQKQISPATKSSEGKDGSLELAESLRKREYACGDNTIEGCGNFCLKPVPGVTEIPFVCREIANKFFGSQGLRQLESAHSQVKKSFEERVNKAENLIFVTQAGQNLVNPQDIGNYIESQARSGNLEAVEKGMDFMIARGFVSKEDKLFALDFVKKVKESDGAFNLDECGRNPESCRQYISKEQGIALDVHKEIGRVFEQEAAKLGIVNYNNCTQGGQFTNECLTAAKASLPRMIDFANKYPDAQYLVEQMKDRVHSAEQGLIARKQAEAKFNSGEKITIGDVIFNKFEDVQNYCVTNGQECLEEAARKGFISRDFAAQKYEQSFDVQRNYVRPQIYINEPNQDRGVSYPGLINKIEQPSGFNKEEALKNFQSWLDNPQGPPPVPGYFTPPFIPPSRQSACSNIFPRPCQQGFYRQEIRDINGCTNYSNECLPIPGYVNQNILPVERINPVPVPLELPTLPIPPVINDVVPPSVPIVPPVPAIIQCDWNTQYLKASRNVCLPRTGCSYPGDPEYNSPECNVIRTSVLWSNSTAPAGQKQIIWNSLGLKSWILTSASEERIALLKAECANVSSNANVWMSRAGDSTSVDFGMPDPVKCRTVMPPPPTPPAPTDTTVISNNNTNTNTTVSVSGNCTPTLVTLLGSGCHNMGNAFFDGNMTKWVVPPATIATTCSTSYIQNCSTGISSTQGQACPAYQYWNGTACIATPGSVTSSCPANIATLLGDGCHPMAEAYFNGPMSKYVKFNSSAVVECSAISISGCPGTTYTATSGSGSCPANIATLLGDGCHPMAEAYFDGPMNRYVKFGSTIIGECSAASITGCSGNTTPVYTSCPAGQYWNNGVCVPTGTYTGSSSCPDNIKVLLGEGCHPMAEAYFNGPMSKYVKFNSSAVVECSAISISGCPGTTYTATNPGSGSCPAAQYWNGTACVASPSGTACAAGEYWNGSICVATSPSGSCSAALQALLGSGCHSMGSAYFDSSMTKWVVPPATVATDCSSSYMSGCTTGSSGSQGQACPAGQYWSGSACVSSTPASSCATGQYWNGSSCVVSSTTGSSCSGTQYWNGSACVENSASTSGTVCPAGQYWSGSACIASPSSTTSCAAGQYWNNGVCVSSIPVVSCTTGQYWNGSSCVNNTAPAPTSATDFKKLAMLNCPLEHDWNGSFCVYNPSIFKSASFLAGFVETLFGWLW